VLQLPVTIRYHDHPEILAHLEQLAAAHPEVETEVVGRTALH
jgi:hypothetical protein